MFKKIFSFSNITLLVALSLSSVAAYYSIIGLTAIFAGAVIPVIIMGSILEVGKITTTVWLRKYWGRAGWILKLYLVPAVIALALLTSMGIFGFLSKAHMDQGVTSGDSQAKVALYDEKIKTQRDNVELARKALQQMDAQVDQMLGRTDSDKGAERAVAIRRQQAKERSNLQADIGKAQAEIQKLNEERAPIAAENRKVEAEVGPIKYIAALIYGDNADANMLEAAVRWVIILLVAVFDPLAIALVLAANASKEWDNEEEPAYEPDDGPIDPEVLAQLQAKANEELPQGEVISKTELFPLEVTAEEEEAFKELEPKPEPEKTIAELHPYLNEEFKHFQNLTPMVQKPEVEELVVEELIEEPALTAASEYESVAIPDVERPGDYVTPPVVVETTGVTDMLPTPDETGYYSYDGKHMPKDVFKSLYPDMFRLTADSGRAVSTNFGTVFPKYATRGDTFVRVDMLPNKVFKFDGKSNWIEVNKETSNSYLYDQEYIKHLIQKIDNGEYDVELLSDAEKEQIQEFLTKKG